VEEIIKDWNHELEERSKQFARQAVALGEWDRQIRSNRNALMALETHLGRVQAAQDATHHTLDFLEVHQKEIHEGLESIEAMAEQMLANARPQAVDAAAGAAEGDASYSDALFTTAEELSLQLRHMGAQLREIVQKVNAQQEVLEADKKDPLAQVTCILNNQLNAISFIDREADLAAERLADLLHSADAQPMR
jgi:hypothetical protein